MALQKIERKISYDLYITAFVISLIIFGVGVWFGLQIENSVSNQINTQISQMNNRMLAIANLILMENDKSYCGYLETEMQKFDSETYELGKQIVFMEEKRGISDEIKSNYMELEFRDYLLSNRINQQCEGKQNIILYFTSSSECDNCKEQGNILTSVRQKTNTRVYTFDVSVSSPIVDALTQKYNIKVIPSLVINGELNNGFISEEQIITKLQK